MVLQDVNDPSSDNFNDNPYPSENDPYDSSSSPSNHYDASSLPQPIPIIGPILGFSSAAVRFKTESTMKFAEERVNRRLTPEEAQALASHLYKLEQVKSYYTAGGASLGLWRWYTTMAKNQYPFYKPKPEDINPNKFLFVKGPWAQYARHSWRLFLYTFVAGEMGKLIGQIVAQPIAAQDTSRDPKLEKFGQDLKASFSGDGQGAGFVPAAREKEWRERINRERAGYAPMRKPAPTPAQKDEDDMSPTSGNESWGSLQSSWSDSGSSSDSSPGVSQQRRSSSSRSEDDADASRTGDPFQEESQSQSQSQPRASGSAWERLRRGGAPTPLRDQRPPPSHRSEPQRAERKEESTLGDSFTFVEDDEERKRERERAQREFDARIERERQGKDFNEDGKRW